MAGKQAEEDDETGDSPTFRIVVVAELGAKEAHRAGDEAEPGTRSVTLDDFDTVMADVAGRLVVESNDGKKVELKLDGLKVFDSEKAQAFRAHPEVRRLEQLWRSLRFLVERATEAGNVDVMIVPAAEDEEEAALGALAASDSDAFDVVVLGGLQARGKKGATRATRAALAGQAMQAPVLLSGDARIFGQQEWSAIKPSGLVVDPALASVATDDTMRWLFIALNGVAFNPTKKGSAPRAPVLPAFALAALCAESFGETGWPTPITAPDRGLKSTTKTLALSLESTIEPALVQALAEAGFATFVAAGPGAALVQAPSVWRAPDAKKGGSESTLADALFVGALVRALRELGAAIPAGTPEAKINNAVKMVVADMLDDAPPPGAQVEAKSKNGKLALTVRPNGFAGVSLPEVTLELPLH